MKEWAKDAMECIRWFWAELRRTDLGDSEHYPNGFRKFSCMEPIQYIHLATAVICLIASLIALSISTR